MSNQNGQQDTQLLPIDQNEYGVSATLWQTLSAEIQRVSTRIDTKEPLDPDDFVKVRALRTQVDEYITSFNRLVLNTQKDYKFQIQAQLIQLGYDKIETYIAQQRTTQTQEQNQRVSDKLQALQDIVQRLVNQSVHIKQSCLHTNLLSLLINRFPKLKSGAKSNDVKNWAPYEQVISTSLQMVESFLSDTDFPYAYRLPLNSKTMQQICTYLRTGELDALRILRSMYQADSFILEDMYLRDSITNQTYALSLIQDIVNKDTSVQEKMYNINRIMEIAKSLPIGTESENN